MRRGGSEPVQARSPLRLRLGLALLGVGCGTAAAVGFALAGRPGRAAVLAAVAALAAVDAVVVLRRIRQGARYQPGREVPPYRPAERKRWR
ncbi:DUF6343 family protein [Actinacidiphila sp. ITFR-21]|uniref:DUF6343 family protein n=1 Tax=Actinacidiphila sp. ITFR-21 TaxID=3075199 RepID=UPI002889A310|nr:DUF6343 family protein [Streptomyces sp. ITFR-21]WNI18657.1 DUF6343 family protein [Streptomyces sp. ITFR-21]